MYLFFPPPHMQPPPLLHRSHTYTHLPSLPILLSTRFAVGHCCFLAPCLRLCCLRFSCNRTTAGKNLRAEPSPPPSFRLLYKVEKSKDLRTVCRFMNLKGGKRHNGRLHGNSLHLRRARVQAPLLNGTRPMLSHRNMKVRGQTHIKDNKP